MITSKILRNVGLLAAGVFLLAGCTWFNNNQDKAAADDISSTGIADQSQKNKVTQAVSDGTGNELNAKTSGTSATEDQHAGLVELSRPDFGFKTWYAKDYNLNESVSCVEGCPTGEEVPLLDLIGPQSHVAIEVYGSESRAVRFLGSGFNNVAGFMASGMPRQVKKQPVDGGMRYDFVLPGITSASPGIAPNTPDQVFVFFVGADGQTFGLSTPKGAGAEDALQAIANNFEFVK